MKAFPTGIVWLAAVALAGCWQSSADSPPVSAPLLPAEQPGILPATAPAPQTDPPACSEPQVRISSPAETHSDYSKAMINAQVAYDLGLTGRCVSVGVIDFGLTSVPHPDLPQDRIDIYPSSSYNDRTYTRSLGDGEEILPLSFSDHGIAVAGVVAAAADGVGMHGVAPGARVWHGLQITAGPDHEYLRKRDQAVRDRFREVMEGVSILNMSWRWSGTYQARLNSDTLEPYYSETLLRRNLPLTLAQFAQAATDEDERIIFVWAAGNHRMTGAEHETSLSLPGGLATHIAELRRHWLLVTAVDENGDLRDSAVPCGIGSDHCLAAPGACILAPIGYARRGHSHQVPSNTWLNSQCPYYSPHGSLYYRVNGTSISAPIVSGALALMIERFRGQLGNTAVVQRVLATANKQGRYSDSALYGQGLLDVGAAVQPVGRSSLMLGGQPIALDGLAAGLVDASGLLSLLGSGLRGLEIMVWDELGAPFWHAFAQLPGAVAHPFDGRWSQLPLAIDRRLGHSSWRQRLVQHSSLTAAAAPGYALDSRGSSPSGRSLIGGDGISGQGLDNRGGDSSGSALSGQGDALGSALASRGDDSSGVFVGVGVHPGWLMGAYAGDGLRIGDFGGHRAFVAPALQQVAAGAVGGGVTLDLGVVSWSAALFRGRSVGDIDASGEENSLLMAEYRRDGSRGFWLLQAGVVEEPGSWLGVRSEGSVYGGFGARTGYLNLMGLWAPGSSWQVLGSWYRSGTELQPLAAGLLVSVAQVQSDQLELGVLKRSVLRAGDALGLRWVGSVQRAEGVSWWLPIGLYRRQVQYADPVQNLKSPLQQRAEAIYGLSLGRSSRLWLRLGRDRGLTADGYAALSLTLGL